MCKKLDHGAQFQWEWIFSAVQLRRLLRESDAESTTKFRCSPSKAVKGHWTQKVTIGGSALAGKQCFAHWLTLTISLWVWLEARKSPTRLLSPHCVHRQGSTLVCKPVALQIGHSRTTVARSLDADLSTDHRSSSSPEQSGGGLLKLQQRKYSQSVKDQGEDVDGTRVRLAL